MVWEDPNKMGDIQNVLGREQANVAQGQVPTAFLTWPAIGVVVAALAVATCMIQESDRDSDALAKDTLVGNVGWVKSVAYKPDGRTLFSVGMDGLVVSWDLTTRPASAFRPSGLGSGLAHGVVMSSEKELFAAAHERAPVSLYQQGENETRGRSLCDELGETVAATCLAFTADGATLAVGQQNGKITLWDPTTGRKRITLKGHDGFVASLAFAPDGATLASSGSGHATRIWDVPTGKERFVITSPVNTYVSLSFSRDARLLFMGDHVTAVVRVWDMAANAEHAALKGPTGAVIGLAISPDGTTLAAADYQGSVTFWDLGTLNRREMRLSHAGARALAFAPDGRTLATGGFDGTTHLWTVPTSSGG